MKSLNEGDDRVLVTVRAAPMREFEDEDETQWTQSWSESIGDHAKTKRVYQSIVGRMKDLGLIEREGRSDHKA